MLPGTVGPEKGNAAAVAEETMALKTAAPNHVLKKEEDTKRSERVSYATILCKEKQKDDGKYSRGCDGLTCSERNNLCSP